MVHTVHKVPVNPYSHICSPPTQAKKTNRMNFKLKNQNIALRTSANTFGHPHCLGFGIEHRIPTFFGENLRPIHSRRIAYHSFAALLAEHSRLIWNGCITITRYENDRLFIVPNRMHSVEGKSDIPSGVYSTCSIPHCRDIYPVRFSQSDYFHCTDDTFPVLRSC